MTEQQIQSKIIKEIESQGYYVIKLIKTNKNGIPDLLVLPKNSDAFFIEVKKESGVLSKLQEYRINELNKHGLKTKILRG